MMDRFYAFLEQLAARGLLPEALRYPFVARGLLAVLVLAPLLGGMSHLVVARRLAFFSTSLGQAALTGITIGLLAGEPIQAPYAGVIGFSLLSAIGMVYVKRRSRLPPDTLIGVFTALTLGLGICLLVAVTKQFNIHQIEAVMFGSLLTVTDTDLLVLVVVALGVLGVLARTYNALLLDSASPSLARVARVDGARIEYLFVVLLTLAIVVSLKIIGALLVEALVVVPAAAARNLARSTRGYFAWSVLVALVTGLAGIWISTRFRVPTGGAVVLALALCFFATLALGGRNKGVPPT
ncbi:Manganese transport system membrane protein mntB [Minicystis rosea]|nr:Manganese transport system membrane protein mntB [Minicystis rosea]